MGQEIPQYSQVTPEQIQLWLNDPVTKVYFEALGLYLKDVRDNVADSVMVDSSSADLTHANIHINMGQQQGLTSSLNHANLFDRYDCIFVGDKADD